MPVSRLPDNLATRHDIVNQRYVYKIKFHIGQHVAYRRCQVVITLHLDLRCYGTLLSILLLEDGWLHASSGPLLWVISPLLGAIMGVCKSLRLINLFLLCILM